MKKSVLAIAAHPDDIEFNMAGTMLKLVELGWEASYFNIANGCCGSDSMDKEQCATTRLQEAQRAASSFGAKFYPPICNDLEIFYNAETLRKVAAVLRQAAPTIVLTHAPVDYMEDHQNACRLAVTAAFSRGMPNFDTQPPTPTLQQDIALYHAQPHGNRTPLKQIAMPEWVVDVSDLMERKRELLACHKSQQNWLDSSQGMSLYLDSMTQLNAEVGQWSGQCEYAEGWIQHLHLGLAPKAEFNPLVEALGESCCFAVEQPAL